MDETLRDRLRGAVHAALGGDWRGAHLVVQDHDDEPLANWIHAVVHRMEGDTGNAAYWFERTGRPFRQTLSIDDELREIEHALDAHLDAAPVPGDGKPRARRSS